MPVTQRSSRGAQVEPAGSELAASLTVVIPTLNEAEAISRVIDEVVSVGVPRDRILVVDGGSTDGTVEIVRGKGVKLITQEGRGKSDAVRTAARHVDTPYTLIMDGDYTYPAQHIPELYRLARQGYDLVIGWRRHVEPGAQTLAYRVGNRLLTAVFNLLFGTRLHDVLSGMYIMRTEVLRSLSYETRGFSIETEIAAHVASTGGRIAEVPITYRRRLGEKKLRVRHGITILRDMIRLAWSYNPVFTVTLLGSLLLAPGLALGGWVAYRYIVHGVLHYMKGLAAITLTATGLLSLILSILSLYLKRMEIRLLRTIRALARENQ